MLRFAIRVFGLCFFCLVAAAAQAADDVVLRAMNDELARTMKQLQLEQLEKPYFVAYRVHEKQSSSARASFGAIIQSSSSRSRFLTVEVRVGSPQLDNTNFMSMSFLQRGGLAGGFAGITILPIEDSYEEIRRQLWLATDNAYKKAVEDLSRKRAALETRSNREEIPDFSTERPSALAEPAAPPQPSLAAMEDLARRLSAAFRASPEIFTCSATVQADYDFVRYVNSEGTTFTRNDPAISVLLSASTQAEDGTPTRDSMVAVAHSLEGLPPTAALEARARQLAEGLAKIRSAPTLARYGGPVLFRGQAAADLFAMVVAPALIANRLPISDEPQFELVTQQLANPYQDQIGRRVLPHFMTVVDDPTVAQYQQKPVLGRRRVDDDGVPARRTLLVEKGVLKALLATRVPVDGIVNSTGSRRGGSALPSNLVVTIQGGVSDAELEAHLLRQVKLQELPYGLIVDRLANPFADPSPEGMMSVISQMMPGRGGEGPSYLAASATRIYPDGREEAVRNVAVSGVTPSSFKDVVAAGATPLVNNTSFLSTSHAVFSVYSGGSAAEMTPQPASFVVPSLLFDDLTARWPPTPVPKPPASPRPAGN